MDFSFTPEELDLKAEVESFVKDALPDSYRERSVFWPGGYGTLPEFEIEYQDFCRGFLKELGARGWLNLSWPEEWGGQGSMMKQALVGDVLSYHRAPTGAVATAIAGPTILLVGSQEMKEKYLPKIAAGEIGFWLGYSEPGAGSDLVSLRTSAAADGDDFIINGQKIWSSGAHVTDYAWLLARTDPDARQHQGASLFIVDNKTPGIDIRPIINICGLHSFNEVFFDNVRVPRENLVGQLHHGFYNVMLALQFERLAVGSGAFRRVLDELIQCAKEIERDGRPLARDPHIRSRLAEMAAEIEVFYGFYWRTVALIERGQVPELEASGMKVFFTELGQKLADLALDLLGPEGLIEPGDSRALMRGRAAIGYLDSVSGPIGAGTSEIQRTIIATRGLGLPRK